MWFLPSLSSGIHEAAYTLRLVFLMVREPLGQCFCLIHGQSELRREGEVGMETEMKKEGEREGEGEREREIPCQLYR